MTPASAREIAAEQIRYWQVRGITLAMAKRALGASRAESWALVHDFMVRWLLAEHGAERLAA